MYYYDPHDHVSIAGSYIMSMPVLSFSRSPALPFVEMRRALNSNACFHTHTHDEFSFGIIDNGMATYQNQHKANLIGKGVTVMINPGEAHSCNPAENEWSYRMLFVDTGWISRLQEESDYAASADYTPFPQKMKNDANTWQEVHYLYLALAEAGNQLQAETQLVYLLNEVIGSPKTKTLTHNNRCLKVARELLLDQPSENLSLTDISRSTGLSRFQLIRSFKAIYGQTPHAYLLDYRIKLAKNFLQQGRGLSEVAADLGFSDQAHFQRHFKKRVAVTPKQYQNFFSNSAL
ncbi:MAG: AraC family transcriptional regulator [Reinekea sp.]